jgi:hypothetical protein
MKKNLSVLLLTGCLLVVLPRIGLAADADSCTAINSVPATISQPGIYCLNKDIATTMSSGIAITIEASDVTLDLHGYRLGDEGAGVGTTAIGILAFDFQNITIRNGTIKGFFEGVVLGKNVGGVSRGHRIEKLRLESITSIPIGVVGSANVIRGNQILGAGGSTAESGLAASIGIAIFGNGNRVLDNEVFETVGRGTLAGVAIEVGGNDAIIENNRVGNSALPATGGSFGITFDCCFGGALVVNNRITRMTGGIFFGTSTGKYRDNLTSGVTTPYSGGTNAGNNN